MKNFRSFTLMMILLCFTLHQNMVLISQAENQYPKTSEISPDAIDNRLFFEYISEPKVSADAISGLITLINNTQNIYPELFISTELFKTEIADTQAQQGIIRKELQLMHRISKAFSIGKMEQLNHAFSHPIPFKLFKGDYVLHFKIYNALGTQVDFASRDILNVGSEDASVYYDEKKSFLSYKGEAKIAPLSGPTIQAQEFPVFHMHYTNQTGKQVEGNLNVKIYARSPEYAPVPVLDSKLESIKLNVGESKVFPISLPSFANPESYLAEISLQDAQGNSISNLAQARYVMEGISAKILDMHVGSIEDGKIKVEATLMGSADDTTLENALVLLNVVNAETNQAMYASQTMVTLFLDRKKVDFTFLPENDVGDIAVTLSIVYADKTLSSETLKYNIKSLKTIAKNLFQKVNEPETQFTDIQNHPFKKEIAYLAAKGILAGYPDNAFKPDHQITRAEATTLFYKMYENAWNHDGAVQKNNLNQRMFVDIQADFWAKEFIQKAQEIEFINGYPDGSFKPNHPISYTEIFAISINFLNKKEDVEKRLGWPIGVLQLAFQLNIPDGLSFTNSEVPIPRGDVAKVVYNLLKAKGKIE